MLNVQDELGTVEIKGRMGRVERVYFHIDPARRRQWQSQHLQVCAYMVPSLSLCIYLLLCRLFL